MPQDETADLTQLFGGFSDEPEPTASGEGDTPAQPGIATGKESSGTQPATSEPPTDAQPSGEPTASPTDKDERLQRIIKDYERLKKFEPLIEIMEEEPALARQLVARQLGVTQTEPAPQSAPVVQAQPQHSPEEVKQYWAQRIEQDPTSAVADLIRLATTEATAGVKTASMKSLISNYKSRRRTEDTMFQQYEPLFDLLAQTANADYVLQYPDQTLAAVENLALGTWAREQRDKAVKAKARGTAAPARETPQTLTQPTVSQPTGPTAKPKRQLSAEEQYLATMYPDLADALTDDDNSTTWGR